MTSQPHPQTFFACSSTLFTLLLLASDLFNASPVYGLSTDDQTQVQNGDHQETILFGSCNRQNLPQDFWDSFDVFDAKNFLWTGDAVYTENSKVDGLQSALTKLLSNEHYLRFRNRTKIYGTWDDHDFGVNDGGNRVSEIPRRKQLYRSFLKDPADDVPSASFSHPQDEIFHTFVIGKAPVAIRFILLDTRSYREDHWIPSLGEYKFIPLSALFAAGIRLIYSSLGYGFNHSADILGEKQWNWLEKVLQQSTTAPDPDNNPEEKDFIIADFHVVVSSIQLFTSNPIVESWNHFPVAKKRLMNLFQKYNPSGLVFLSGDIHASEISTATVHYSLPSVPSPHTSSAAVVTPLPSSQWFEITSSGLTHNCRGSFITRSICPIMMDFFHTHRLATNSAKIENDTPETATDLATTTSSSSLARERSMYSMENNVGVIRSFLVSPSEESNETACSPSSSPSLSSSYLEIEVYSLPLSTTLVPVLHQRIYPHHHLGGKQEGDGEGSGEPPLIVDVEYVTFPHLSETLSISVLVSALCGLVALIRTMVLLFGSS